MIKIVQFQYVPDDINHTSHIWALGDNGILYLKDLTNDSYWIPMMLREDEIDLLN